jgi:hypothetical protein
MASPAAKESILGTVVTYIGVGIGFLTTFFILAKFLTPEEIGLTRLLPELATQLSGLGMLGMTYSLSRYFPFFKDSPSNPYKKEDGPNHGFLFYVLSVGGIGALSMIALYILAHDPLIALYSKNSPLLSDFYYAIIPLTLFTMGWTIFELYTYQLMKVAVPKGIKEVLLRVLQLAVYLLYAFGYIDFTTMVWGFIGSFGICMLTSGVYLGRITPLSLRHNPSYISPELRRGFYRYTALYTLTSVGITLAGRMDLFMVAFIDQGGLTSAGVYTMAFYMVSIIEIPMRAILSIAAPKIADAAKEGDTERVEDIYKLVAFYQLLAGLLIFIMIWVNIDNIFGIMPNGEQFEGGKWIFFFLGLAKLVELTLTCSHTVVSTSRYYHWNVYYTCCVLLMSFLSTLFLIPWLGTMGAALAMLLTNIISYGLQQLLLSMKMHIHPFSRRMLLLLPLALLAWGANTILPTFSSVWIDLFIRSVLIGLVLLVLLLLMRITPELMGMLEGKLPARFRK